MHQLPSVATQAELWRSIVGDVGDIEQVCTRYPLAAADIAIAASEVRAETTLAGRPPMLGDLLVAARVQLRQRLGEAAELVSTRLSLADVIRGDVTAAVRELVDVVQRGERSIRALLAGPPGSGKTIVATVIGQQLKRDVFRVSRYGADVESQLALVFDEARRHNAILLFDDVGVPPSLVRHLATHDGVVIMTAGSVTGPIASVLREGHYRIELSAPDECERARRNAAVRAAYRAV